MHGSWPLGVALFAWEAVWLQGRRRWILAALLAVSLACIALLPAGHGVAQQMRDVLGPQNAGTIVAWGSPEFHNPGYLPLLLLVLGLPALYGRELIAERDYARLGWLLGACAGALLAVRFMPYAGVGFAAVLGLRGAHRLRATPRPRDRLFEALAALAALALLLGAARQPYLKDRLAGSLHYLERHRAQDVFADAHYGGALELEGIRPLLDGRTDIWVQYGLWPDYLRASGADMPLETFLARWDPGARWAVWPLGSPVGRELSALGGWRLVYRSGGIGVWRRTPSR